MINDCHESSIIDSWQPQGKMLSPATKHRSLKEKRNSIKNRFSFSLFTVLGFRRWAFHNQGSFLLRMEETKKKRFIKMCCLRANRECRLNSSRMFFLSYSSRKTSIGVNIFSVNDFALQKIIQFRAISMIERERSSRVIKDVCHVFNFHRVEWERVHFHSHQLFAH